jgi:hypothetical protein
MTKRGDHRNRRPKNKPRSVPTAATNKTKDASPSGLKPPAKKGIFTEYLDKKMTPPQLHAERQKQLRRISELRDGRAVLAYSADFQKGPKGAPIGIDYSDLTPINDQISILEGDRLDLILETPGGLGDVAEDIVKLLRHRFSELNIIVPGSAKSAGTIIAMAGDEILMEQVSSLGPIDAQISYQGKQFSADAFIQGLEDIKAEVDTKKALNQAFIPILQNISPGEIRHAENMMEFARELVRTWLVKYKFKNWNTRKRDGSIVTEADKVTRANKIATELSNHSKWKTHSKSVKIDDLRQMELLITDYSEMPELADAIRRYHVLVEMTFRAGPIYKLFETPTTFIMRHSQQQNMPVAGQPAVAPLPKNATQFDLELTCGVCGNVTSMVGGIGQPAPKKPGSMPFPVNNSVNCKNCGNVMDVAEIRKGLEQQTGKKIYS